MGNIATTIEEAYNQQIKDYRAAMPRIDGLYSGLPGSWDIKGAQKEASDMYDTGYAALVNKFGMSSAEAEYASRRKVIETLKLRSTDQKQASIVVTDKDTGNSIVVHMKIDGTGTLTPKADKEDFAGAVAALNALRAGGLYRGKVTAHLIDNNSIVPSNVSPGTVAFTYDGADAIYAYVDKVRDQVGSTTTNPGYWSTDITTLSESYKHFISHEVGHQLAEQIYGTQDSKKIEAELDKFYNSDSGSSSGTAALPSPADVSDDVKAILDRQSTKEDFSAWDNTQGAMGSNPGGTWKDPNTGEQIYAKFQQTPLHAENERLASAIYNFFGIEATDILSGTVDGKDATYSKYVPGVQTNFDNKLATDPAYKRKVQEGFAVDALLANWDATLNDNIVTNADGNPVRIDVGGSLLFRARGTKKGAAFGENVLELDTFTRGIINPSAVSTYSSMSQQDQTDSAKLMQKFTDADVDALVDGIVTDKSHADLLKSTLKKRRDYILGKYGLTGVEAAARDKANEESNKVKPAGDQPVPAISTRGADSPAENFAELFAKYVATGEAPEWFINLLEANGYAKGKKNTSWRKNIDSPIEKEILNHLDIMLAEIDDGMYPELNTKNYGRGTKLGSASAHRLARLLGVANNTSKVVDDIDPSWQRFYRGVGAATVDGKHMTTKEMHANFATSPLPYFSTTTYYGDGSYAATDRSEAVSYGQSANYNDNSVIEMGVDPSAKIAILGSSGLPTEAEIWSYIEKLLSSIAANEREPGEDENSAKIKALVRELMKKLPLTGPTGNGQSNIYGLLGYDAIRTGRGSGSYIVILNRAILQVRKKDIT